MIDIPKAPKAPKPAPYEIQEGERMLTTKEAVIYLRVEGRTVRRWADEGRLAYQRNERGHRRYPERQVRKLARSMGFLSIDLPTA